MSYLTEERLMIQEAARKFTMKEVFPLANKLDPKKGKFPDSLIEKLADAGYFGITVPEEYGGLGLGCFEYCLITEELSRGWMSVASLIARGNTFLTQKSISAEMRSELLPKVAVGKFLIALAMSEPNAGSDVTNITCRAVKDGDSWVITGNKYWCTFADGADSILVIARTGKMDPKARHKGLSAFLVDKPRGQLPKNVEGNKINKIGYFGWDTFELAFDGCRVPAEKMVGEEGKAFYMISGFLESARAHTAARAIGLARGALEDAQEYCMERRQFGQAIGEFQAIRFKIAEMATQIEASRQLMYFVADAIDTGNRCDLQASMVKLLASEMSEKVTSEALQIFGGAGYTTDYAVERYWRDARLTTIFEGTSEIQKRIISDKILGR